MSQTITVVVHKIATDGLPGTDYKLTGRVAFIWNGAIVSGWPIDAEFGGVVAGEQLWEPSEDCFGGPLFGVTHWIEFPTEVWNLGKEL